MVKKVQIESDALQVCLMHALSTEKEEVMGLLIGEVLDNISHVYAVILLRRLDKRKDRVEISPEQLSSASTDAERIGLLTKAKKPMRIIGWYHSHPHITVWPSHVDVRTQAMYQLMDADFVGVIISCFSNDAANIGKIQTTCFQSANVSMDDMPRYERLEIEVEIIPSSDISDACLEALSSFPTLLLQEEAEEYRESLSYTDQDLLTAVQNGSVFTQNVMRIIEIICAPMLHNMELQVSRKKKKLEELQFKLETLKTNIDTTN